MTKHTPGPWKLNLFSRNDGFSITAHGKVRAIVPNRDNDVIRSESTPEGLANAHLIKCSPELLEVLKRYVSAYPAFRIKPVGAPGSEKRIEQENLMALEDEAQRIIASAEAKN